jgi:hypothetical protein
VNRPENPQRIRAFALMLAIAALVPTSATLGQITGSDQLSKILTDPEKLEELKKEKQRPPIEFFRSQILPNDILPYLKANHWSMSALEMRSNHDDYEGSLQSRPVALADQPHEIFYRRDAKLIKGQRARLTLPIFLPVIPKEIGLQLIRPEAIRQDEEWLASLRPLEPHQQMVVVLSKNPNDPYARWSQYRAALPSSARRDDPLLLEKQRYYRMVLPLDPEKPQLSAHPLTWSAISHVIWDGLSPELLGVGQQQAMLDWLHWGGQLVIVGGAGPGFAPLRESFLAPYLPAEPSGENVMRSGAELKSLSDAYPPAAVAFDPDDPTASNISWTEAYEKFGRRYRPPVTIPATEKKPLFIAALKAKPGATAIPLGGPGDPPLGVEWRVGRGRVLMLAIGLTDPDLAGWAGFDTLVRRVVLRRPEERLLNNLGRDASGGIIPPRYDSLVGPDLTGLRYLSRDLGAPTRRSVDEDGVPISSPSTPNRAPDQPEFEVPIGEWLDSSALPSLSREKLEKASGIEIPGRLFVLKVILAYILALVPLNWLICRYVLGRREWAWVVVPVLSLAFAVGVERAAAYDVGYDSSCDEIDLIETHGDYTRGHLSRFASVYSTGRVRYSISYPNDPTALALPLSTGRPFRGEEFAQSSFQSLPFPALTGFQVQPRSLALFRAEQMANLPGTVTLSADGEGPRTVTNESGLDINDAWVVEVRPARPDPKDGTLMAASLGAIPAGAKVPLGSLEDVEAKATLGTGQLDPGPFLDLLLSRTVAARPEEVGELRLIGWSGKPMGGQVIDPPVDRLRGFTLVVAHLRPAPLPDPTSPRYFALALGAERPPAEPPIPPPDPNMIFRGVRRGGGRALPPPGGMGAGGMGGLPVVVPAPVAPTPAPTAPPAPQADPNSAPPPDPNSNALEIPRP